MTVSLYNLRTFSIKERLPSQRFNNLDKSFLFTSFEAVSNSTRVRYIMFVIREKREKKDNNDIERKVTTV